MTVRRSRPNSEPLLYAKRRKRLLAPRPADPPRGHMWWHGELMTIAIVERLAKRIMGNHDDRPRARRDRDNEGKARRPP